jgi:hypothetical protein
MPSADGRSLSSSFEKVAPGRLIRRFRLAQLGSTAVGAVVAWVAQVIWG